MSDETKKPGEITDVPLPELELDMVVGGTRKPAPVSGSPTESVNLNYGTIEWTVRAEI